MGIFDKFFEPNLKTLKMKRDVNGLITLLKKHENLTMQRTIIGILGDIGDSRAVEMLIDILKSGNEYTQKDAAEALGKIGDDQGINPLINTLDDEDSFLREYAAEALKKMGWNPSNQNEQISYLIATKKWNELVKIGTPAIDPLIAILKDTDPSIRKNATEALKIFDNSKIEKALPLLNDIIKKSTLIDAPKNNDPSTRQKAADDVASLIKTLNDNSSEVRQSAAISLLQFERPLIYNHLILILRTLSGKPKDASFNVSSKVTEAPHLKVLRGTRAIELLISLLNDTQVDMRIDAAEVLGLIGDPIAVDPLIRALMNNNAIVRSRAIVALGRIGAPAIEPLILNIQNSSDRPDMFFDDLCDQYVNTDYSKRGQAISALRLIHDPNAVALLIEALKSSMLVVRLEAIMLLGILRDTKAIDSLTILLKNENPDICRCAAEALENIKNASN